MKFSSVDFHNLFRQMSKIKGCLRFGQICLESGNEVVTVVEGHAVTLPLPLKFQTANNSCATIHRPTFAVVNIFSYSCYIVLLLLEELNCFIF